MPVAIRRAAVIERTSTPPLPSSVFTPQFLLQQSRWIRDDLDPQVARNGPNALRSDDLLILDQFLRRLQDSKLALEDIRYSRLHLAMLSISGLATRWPKKLIERADELRTDWEVLYGPLKTWGTPLYEKGGRLNGLCKPEDVHNGMLIAKWLKSKSAKINPLSSRKSGSIGFTAGDWWISPIFAFKDGIIDSPSSDGGITADSKGAYALLMIDDEEVCSLSPTVFTYRTKPHDSGRYRLTSATIGSRHPIRVLRSHTLRSFWAPKAGVRYDGLHKVMGWTIITDKATKQMVYQVQFERLPSEPSMDVVLRRPYSDEVEDYGEYKRLRQVLREQQEEAARVAGIARVVVTPTSLVVSPDFLLTDV